MQPLVLLNGATGHVGGRLPQAPEQDERRVRCRHRAARVARMGGGIFEIGGADRVS
jgi:hypothetical protein